MSRTHDYDVVVIGGGIAGLVSAVTANGLGMSVAVIEKRDLGGNCANLTCVPSKALIRAAHLAKDFARMELFGLNAGAVTCDADGVMARVRSVVAKAHEKDLPETFEAIGIHVFKGAAEFLDRRRIRVGERTVSARRFIIAVGTRPLVPPIEGLSDIDYLTNENIYQIDALPKSLIILGGGVDGLEYASAFGRLGVRVTVVEMSPRLLPMADRELVNALVKILEKDGIQLLSGAKASRVRSDGGRVFLRYEVAGERAEEVDADRILVALGRRPDIEALKLDNAGVHYTARGIIVDSKLRTSAPEIYACGDVAGPDLLATTAEYQGIMAATNAVMPVKRSVDYRNSVYVIFTDPPLAYLGLTEAQARRELGGGLKTYRFQYEGMRRAVIDGSEEGLAKFLCDRRGRLVGAHILGEAAPEVIHEAQVIRAFKKPLHKLHDVTHAYPTYAQALVGRAAQLAFLDRMSGSFFVNMGLRLLPGFSNRLKSARDRLAETPNRDAGSRNHTLTVLTHSGAGPKEQLRLNAELVDGLVCVAEAPSELTDHDERPLLTACEFGRSGSARTVVLDCSRLRRMNGLGACMLIKFAARLKARDRAVVAFGVTGALRDVFKVTELDKAIRVFERRSAALSAVGVSCATEAVDSSDSGEFNNEGWAAPADQIHVPPMPKEARNLNVNGRRTVGPVSGFGQLWQKVYRLHLGDASISPREAVAALKERFPEFQPPFNRFYPSKEGIRPGEVVLIDSSTPGGPVSTGVVILYADDLSFTFITPQGHPEAGNVTFSAEEVQGRTVVQIMGLTRANDPLFEAAFHLVGSRIQAGIWIHVLSSLAAYLGAPADVTYERELVDKSLQWPNARNLVYNAQLITLVHEPLRWFRRD
jgi:pyruvate/2-oxoglutarate dehydrogenase complex dihydrolipoamide dehydrogenase (E3) component/anti-anti-sigma regulatory factor